MKKRFLSFLPVLLLALIALQCLTSIRYKSATVEEAVHIAAGVHFLKTGDTEAFYGYPPAGRHLLALLPAAVAGLPPEEAEIRQEMYPFAYASRFLYEENDADAVLLKARAAVVAVTTLLGLGLWRFSVQLAGPTAGIIALAGYAFCPNILAHGRLATLDLFLTAWIFFALVFYRKAILEGRILWGVLCACFAFLALDTKYSGWLVFPIMGGWHLARLFLGKKNLETAGSSPRGAIPAGAPGSMALFGFVLFFCLLMLNGQYGFKTGPITLKQYAEKAALEPRMPTSHLMGQLTAMPSVSGVPLPLPYAYIRGWDLTVFADRDGRHPNWFRGRLYTEGERFWDYYLWAIGLKVPVALLACLLFWVGYVGYLVKKKAFAELEPHVFLLMPILVFFLFYSLVCRNQLGLRLILPLFPFCFLAVALLAKAPLVSGWLSSKEHRSSVAALGGLLAGWYVFSSVWIHPHYLSYFNELAGGPEKGIAWFADSNLDWGQDLKGLKRYMEEKAIPQVHLVYYGPNGRPELDYYGIRTAEPGEAPEAPWAISATWHYYADVDPIKGLVPFGFESRSPGHRIGYSIHIYQSVRP